MSLADNFVWCLRIDDREGNNLLRLCHYVHDLTMSNGVVYEAIKGIEASGFEQGIDAAPPSIDFQTFTDITGITEAQIVSGIFDDARGYLFRTQWHTPVEDEFDEGWYLFGETRIEDKIATIENQSMITVLSQNVGYDISPSCHKEFGGQESGGCMLDIADYQYAFTVTSVTNNGSFTSEDLSDSGSSGGGDNFYKPGIVTFSTGNNAGVKAKSVRSSTEATGGIVLYEPFEYDIEVGDTGIVERRCPKTLAFCKAQVNLANDTGTNVENFGGKSFVPTEEFFTRTGGT